MPNMRLIGGTVLALALLTGCSSGDGSGQAAAEPAPEPTTSAAPELLTFEQVATAACDGKPVRREESPEMMTTASGNCAGVGGIAIFGGPAARRDWLLFVEDRAVLTGPNWAVWIDSFDPMPRYQRIQAEIGGEVRPPLVGD